MKSYDIKRILIPTDFSEITDPAIEHAGFMASIFKAHLYLMHVREREKDNYKTDVPETPLPHIHNLHYTAGEKLNQLATKISSQYGVKVSPILPKANSEPSIASVVQENDIDIIVMGSNETHRIPDLFGTSNLHRVIHAVDCPVISVKQHPVKKGFSRIVVPISNFLYSRQKVNYLIKFATAYGSRVFLICLYNDNTEIARNRFKIKIESVERLLDNADIWYTKKFIKSANITTEVIKYAKEVRADMIMTMAGPEQTTERTLFGILARKLIDYSTIPIMSIKPLQEGTLDSAALSAAFPLF